MDDEIPSRAPKRKRRLTAQNFAPQTDRLSFVFNERSRRVIKAAALRAWNDHIPLTPATAVRILTRDLPAGTTINFTAFDIDGNGELEIEKPRRGDEALFSDSRPFDFSAGATSAGSLFVAEDTQGQGWGRRLMRNEIEFFHACGLRYFDIRAVGSGLSSSFNGAYTWARLGFKPDMQHPENHGFYDRLRDHIGTHGEMLRILAPMIGRDLMARIETLARFDDPANDFWALADMNVDLRPALAAVFNTAGLLNPAVLHDFKRRYHKDFVVAAETGRPLTLGRVLMKHVEWHGTLDMHDPVQMARVGRYCGGWKYVAL